MMLKVGDKIKITNRWSMFFGEILTVQGEDSNGRYICINPSHPQDECVVYSRDNGKNWVYAKEAQDNDKRRFRGGLTMAEVDLKRCPFCGDYAHLEDPSEMGDYGVSCENCGAFVMFGAGDGECQTKEEAAEAWNRRVKDDLED